VKPREARLLINLSTPAEGGLDNSAKISESKPMRQIVLDTETTGLEPTQGHRIIEIGCVELINRRLTGNHYHQYLNPGREIDAAAIEVHGITNEVLADKPRFAEIAREFLAFIKDAELIIHNAPFDVAFIHNELKLIADGGDALIASLDGHCTVLDTLPMARSLHPGQKNSLDALCKRYNIDNSQRVLHGALLDAEILADVYLAMTGGQAVLFQDGHDVARQDAVHAATRVLDGVRVLLEVIRPAAEEIAAHQAWLEEIDRKSGGKCLWKKLYPA
jgi:DNA polymerase-3 subunit epsilon